MPLTSNLLILIITGILTLVGNFIGFKVSPLEAIPGILILIIIAFIGILLSKIIPIKIPSVAYIVTLATILTIPGMPMAELISNYTAKVNFLCRNIYWKKLGYFEENRMENLYSSFICDVRNLFRFCYYCTSHFKNDRTNLKNYKKANCKRFFIYNWFFIYN